MTKFLLPLVFLLIFVSCKKEKNNPPILVDQIFEIDENSPGGTSVGFISASDLEDDVLRYELIAEGIDFPFQVDLNSGELSVVRDETLDFESQEEYIFVVKVYEEGSPNYSNSATITININDVDEIPTQGLVAYYPFNGNANDESGNANHAIKSGSISFVNDMNGRPSSSVYFDGQSHLSVPHDNMFNFGLTDFTLSLWIRNSSSKEQMIFQKGGINDYQDPQIWMRLNDQHSDRNTDITFLTGNGVPPSVTTFVDSNNCSDGNWHHLVAMREGQEIQIYIDGEISSSTTGLKQDVNNNQNLNFGVKLLYNSKYEHFNGGMDEIRIYNRALTAIEISFLYELFE